MKHLVIGIVAHVDAGKTSCIEQMLYQAGSIKKIGHIDHQDTFLDYEQQERDRGITIFNKHAHFTWNHQEIHCIDTPGHIDFSAEMERTLQVLDLAIMIINGCDGVQAHTKTIWKCLEHYQIPTIILVNKMDITHLNKEQLTQDIQQNLSKLCVDFRDQEKLACVNEALLNSYLENEQINQQLFTQALYQREVYPIFFASALTAEGFPFFMNALSTFVIQQQYKQAFGAKIYQISHDEQGNMLAHVKITSGMLKVKDKINNTQKVDQIRLYNGFHFETLEEVHAGMICTLKGLKEVLPGQGLGIEKNNETILLQAYMNIPLIIDPKLDLLQVRKLCQKFAQEDPQLHVEYEPKQQQIYFRIMGDIQKEILQKRFEAANMHIQFGEGQILLKESIQEAVIGVGHFEPLRHYAEVQVLLEPLPRGSGMQFECNLPVDELSLNWQRLIYTHFQEKEHLGVLTGSPITDIKISLLAGKAHLKHTEGGDFRESTYRAIRHALMRTTSILLEPYYQFNICVENKYISKCLFELEMRHCSCTLQDKDEHSTYIHGRGPVRFLLDFQTYLLSLTKGEGYFSAFACGYFDCIEPQKMIEQINYDPLHDVENPCGSVFCAKGAGFNVPYDEVENYMHIPYQIQKLQQKK